MATIDTVMPDYHEAALAEILSGLDPEVVATLALDGLRFAYGVDTLVAAGRSQNGDEWDDAESFRLIADFAEKFEDRGNN